jgi:hypothetical protein
MARQVFSMETEERRAPWHGPGAMEKVTVRDIRENFLTGDRSAASSCRAWERYGNTNSMLPDLSPVNLRSSPARKPCVYGGWSGIRGREGHSHWTTNT